ncbi:MAG: ligase-associated DNA damage response endonuclease PdeM [Verrucomicrobiota bacterium JB022]|nr:ligase-associated DNA damage response endonuclease PdeM [Verrucomicrobiota bacterium JB022]
MHLTIHEHTFDLLPERAVFWREERALLVADLHWGKDAAFRAAGVALPEGLLGEELQRLSRLVEAHDAREILILGDLIHARASLHPSVIEAVAAWRTELTLPITLIEGNHDRHAPQLPPAWQIERMPPPLVRGPFHLAHYPEPVPGAFVWAGHVHPTVNVGRRRESLRLPCFAIGSEVGVLPAFSAFTDGISSQKGLPHAHQCFAIAGREVVEVNSPRRL